MGHSLVVELPAAAHIAPPPRPRRTRLLVIEDEVDVAALLRMHLAELPAEVRLAADGEHGLALALAEDWDLIVLDLRLPRLAASRSAARSARAGGRCRS